MFFFIHLSTKFMITYIMDGSWTGKAICIQTYQPLIKRSLNIIKYNLTKIFNYKKK